MMKKIVMSLIAGAMMFSYTGDVNAMEVHGQSMSQEVVMAAKMGQRKDGKALVQKVLEMNVLNEKQEQSLIDIIGKGILFILGVILRMGNVIVEAIGEVLDWLTS